jgi:hypothetical protein
LAGSPAFLRYSLSAAVRREMTCAEAVEIEGAARADEEGLRGRIATPYFFLNSSGAGSTSRQVLHVWAPDRDKKDGAY